MSAAIRAKCGAPVGVITSTTLSAPRGVIRDSGCR
jgi:hypothetical protein